MTEMHRISLARPRPEACSECGRPCTASISRTGFIRRRRGDGREGWKLEELEEVEEGEEALEAEGLSKEEEAEDEEEDEGGEEEEEEGGEEEDGEEGDVEGGDGERGVVVVGDARAEGVTDDCAPGSGLRRGKGKP